MSNLLEGVRVVELGTHIAIPLAARMLADWGAEVIKVEPPQGEAWRTIARSYGVPFDPDNDPIFQAPNGNKKSIAINLKSEDGLGVMLRLLDKADIFLTNTRMKSLEKLGLDYPSLKSRNPRLIYAHFNGYGPLGPDKDRPGFDVAAYWARAGMPVEWSTKETAPIRPTPGFGDSSVSPSVVAATLAALHHRDISGEGDLIHASLFGTALWYNNVGVVATQPKYGFSYPRSKYDQTAPYNAIFHSCDGMFFIYSLPYWNRFADKLLTRFGMEEHLDDIRFTTIEGSKTDMKTVMDAFDAKFSSMTGQEIRQAFADLDMVFEELTNPSKMTEDEQAWANGYLIDAEMECGEHVVLSANPLHFANADTLDFHLAPQLGADTVDILCGLGYGDGEVSRMLAEKAVAAETKTAAAPGKV